MCNDLTINQHFHFTHYYMVETQQLVNAIIDGIQKKKGRGIVTVDLRKIITAPCAYFVICTASNPLQVAAVTDAVEEFARKKAQEKPAAIAGRENAEWVAMDYGTVMVHIFVPEAREHYDLESLWDDAELTEIADID